MINSINLSEEYCKSKPKCDQCKTCARNIKQYHSNFQNDSRLRFIDWKNIPDHTELENIENKNKVNGVKMENVILTNCPKYKFGV